MPEPSEPRWRLLERRDIHAAGDDTGDVYLRRLYLIDCPLFGVMLHNIRRPDQDRALHDHPFSFVSLILRGGYVEELELPDRIRQLSRHDEIISATPDENPWALTDGQAIFHRRRRHRAGSVLVRPAETLHRITTVAPDCWTLVVHGRRRRTWGFVEAGGEWTDWRTYTTRTAKEPRP